MTAALTVEELGLGALFILAFANGANDVGKSVASVVGDVGLSSPRLTFRRALIWGGVFSGVGTIFAILVSERLFVVFNQGIVQSPTPFFAMAALGGAMLWVLLATLVRFPVSTTHAIVGAIVAEAIYLYGSAGVHWTELAERVILPLAVSPVLALFLTFLLGRRGPGKGVAKEGTGRVNRFHWVSSAATAFARGTNDAPKMAALGSFLLLGSLQGVDWFPYLIVAVAVVFGSLVLGRRVTVTVLRKNLGLEHQKRLTAGFTTAALVSVGALLGAPVSTTHVASGAVAGTLVGSKGILRAAVKDALLPWFVTFPLAGLLAIGVSHLATMFAFG